MIICEERILYAELVEGALENSKFIQHVSSLEIAVDQNEILVSNYLQKKQFNSRL